MEYVKAKYVNKRIFLYPGDTYYKYGIITDLDDLGFTVKITKSHPSNGDSWKVGQEYFISHSKALMFEFLN
jgi:hypothetical protein